MSLDDYQEDSIPWLCDECADKYFSVVGWLALVRKCAKCNRQKCEHCYDDKDTTTCTECMDS